MAATNDDSGANTIDKGKLLVSNPHHSHSRKATTTAMGEQVEVWYRSAHHMLTLSRNTTTRHASLSPSQSRSSSDATITPPPGPPLWLTLPPPLPMTSG